MADRDGGLATVEVAHLARAHMRRADGKPRRAPLDERKVDQLAERLRQRCGRVEAGAVASERIVRAEKGKRIGFEEAWNAGEQGRPIGRGVGEPRPVRQTPEFLALHPAPEFLQPVDAMFGLVAGDEASVDGADRRADDPIGLDPGLVERLIDTRLIGAERTAALEHEHDLESLRWTSLRCGPFLCIRDVPGFRDIQHRYLRWCLRARCSARPTRFPY